jgi:hypothetical protein
MLARPRHATAEYGAAEAVDSQQPRATVSWHWASISSGEVAVVVKDADGRSNHGAVRM